MELKRISDALSVSGQISPADVAELKAKGFRSIICSRPDGEGVDQPTFEEIHQAARAARLEARYLPVTSGLVQDDDAVAFGAALRELLGPSSPIAGAARARSRSGR